MAHAFFEGGAGGDFNGVGADGVGIGVAGAVGRARDGCGRHGVGEFAAIR